MEIGHVGTHDESSQPHVDGLSKHPALATLVFMTQSSIELCASGKAAEVIACRKAQPVLLVVDECWQAFAGGQFSMVVFLDAAQPIAGEEAPLTILPAHLGEMVGGVRGLRSLIACPREVDIVGVGEQLQLSRRLPRCPHQYATLVLHATALTKTSCMWCFVAIAVETLYGHQPQARHRSEAKGVQRGQRTMLVHRRLTAHRQPSSLIAIVDADISKRLAFRKYLTIALGRRGLLAADGLQGLVEAIGKRRESGMPAVVLPKEACASQPFRDIVFTFHLRGCTMIA